MTTASRSHNRYQTVQFLTLQTLQHAFGRAGLKATVAPAPRDLDAPTVYVTLGRFRWMVKSDGTITACPEAPTRLRTLVADVLAVLC